MKKNMLANGSWSRETLPSLSATKLALVAKQMREQMKMAGMEPIAIVGMGCRFPGAADDPRGFWQALVQSRDAVSEIPPERWNAGADYDPQGNALGRTYTRHGAFLSQITDFDAGFFGISPRESVALDPQQRLVLEVVHEAIENAALPPEKLAHEHRTGVFIGIRHNEYQALLAANRSHDTEPYMCTGNARSFVSGRLSYFYGFRGASLSLDTACSSSLVAVHVACQSLRVDESDVALAGGVNLMVTSEETVMLAKMHALSPEGRCKTFDVAADGFVRGEGCGIVVLKRLSDALRDQDHILAVIRGSAVNQDGARGGLTVPNGLAQQEVIRQALYNGGVSAAEVSYIEAHGTGTSLGDPIEMGALGQVFGPSHTPERPLYVGSVKTNIGHLEAAAGIAGLVKVVLGLQHGQIPAHLHFRDPNPHIAWDRLPVRIPTATQPWPSYGSRRVAGVSSFGMSGTNAHVIVEEAPAASVRSDGVERPWHLLTVSARTGAALSALCRRYDERLSEVSDEEPLGDLCYTANTGRRHWEHRLCVLAGTRSEMREQLAHAVAGSASERLWQGRVEEAASVGFALGAVGEEGGGSWHDLYETQPTFRSAVDRCLSLCGRAEGVKWSSAGSLGLSAEQELFCVQYGLSELWRSWGVEPVVVMGVGVGEYVAGVVSGVLNVATAWSRLGGQEPGGAARYGAPDRALVSGRWGRLVHEQVQEKGYWSEVGGGEPRVREALETVVGTGCRVVVELGSGGQLTARGRELGGTESITWLPSGTAWESLLSALAAGYVRGVQVDWRGFDRDYARRKVVLPTYPWQRQRYWVPTASSPSAAAKGGSGSRERCAPVHPLLGYRLDLAGGKAVQFENNLSCQSHDFLLDHRICDTVVFPAAGYLEMALAATVGERGATSPITVEDVQFQQALKLPPDQLVKIQTVVTQEPSGRHVEVYAREEKTPEGSWTLHSRWKVVAEDGQPADARAHLDADLASLQKRCSTTVEVDAFYNLCRAWGIEYGPRFCGARGVWKGGTGEYLGHIALHDSLVSDLGDYTFHPVLLDACMQMLLNLSFDPVHRKARDSRFTFVPTGIKRFVLWGKPDLRMWSYVRVRSDGANGDEAIHADLWVFDSRGELVAELEHIEARYVERDNLLAGPSVPGDHLYEVAWRPQEESRTQRKAVDYLDMTTLDDRLKSCLARMEDRGDLKQYEQIVRGLDRLSVGWIVSALLELGFSFEPGLHLTSQTLLRRLGIQASYDRLLDRYLEILGQEGLLRRQGDRWEVVRAPTPMDRDAEEARLREYAADAESELALVTRCGRHLAEALQGRVDPLELLFPGGDSSTLASLYRDSLLAKIINGLMTEAVRGIVAQLPAGRSLRVLEIGAGTGGTTCHVVPHCPADRTEYVFTDISDWFVSRAREAFSHYPFVHYRALNIERDLESQGLDAAGYDVVIATNVLHATRDLRASLSHVKQLLSPQGVVLLLEGVLPQHWVDLTFGLTEGWWRFADASVRGTYPLLSCASWDRVLSELGFGECLFIGTESFWQRLVVGRRLGTNANHHLSLPRWLVFSDHQGLGPGLCRALRDGGSSVTVAYAGDRYQPLGDDSYLIDASCAADYKRLYDHIHEASGPGPMGIVYLWGLDSGPSESLDVERLSRSCKAGCEGVLHVAQTLSEQAIPAKLWLVTRDAQAATGAEPLTGVGQAPLWGLGRTLGLEYPEVGCVCVDVDAEDTPALVDALLSELGREDHEDRVCYRGGRRYLARLIRQDAGMAVPQDRPYRLEISGYGSVRNIDVRPMSRRNPAGSEIEIEVHAAGLNFHDVLRVMGLLQDAPVSAAGTEPRDLGLGCECAGKVVAVGPQAAGLRVGDEVIAFGKGCMASHAIVNADHVLKLPGFMSLVEGATIPAAFLTAYYALCRLAGLQAKERILIHAAAGGVGQAAVQIAQWLTAEIFATAHPRKWDYLKSQGLENVMNSRTLDFADDVMAATNGQGVDVVLNCLSGPAIPAGLSVLKRGGRFVELGRRGILSPEVAVKYGRDISYHTFDLGVEAGRQPGLIASLFADLQPLFERRVLRPLPHVTVSWRDAHRAFQNMQTSRHIGKIVLSDLDANHGTPIVKNVAAPFVAGKDKTYLITGGFGGLGLQLACWLAEGGARHLVLAGRRGAVSEDARTTLTRLRERGVQVHEAGVDVSDYPAMECLLNRIRESMPALGGVIHAAGLLQDGLLMNMDWPRFSSVLAAKVLGGWNLHVLTSRHPLDFFVLFSSMASLLGSAGQANHAAANAFLDALAHYRRSLGLHALALNWGGWSEKGAAAERSIIERLDLKGMGRMRPVDALRVLANALALDQTQLGAFVVHWQRFFEKTDWSPFYSEMAPLGRSPKQETAQRSRRFESLTPGERNNLFRTSIRRQIGAVLGLAPESITDRDRLMELGADSLTAIELRNRLQGVFGCALPATLLYDYPTVEALVRHVCGLFASGAETIGSAPEGTDDNQEPSRTHHDEDDGRRMTSEIQKRVSRLNQLLEERL